MAGLWRTLRAYFLPSAHPGLRPVRAGGGEEFRPKRDARGQRVEAAEWRSVWDGHIADRNRAHNRALVRPYMGAYIRRWLGLAAVLWLLSHGLGLAGLVIAAWGLFVLAVLALLTGLLLVLLRQELSG